MEFSITVLSTYFAAVAGLLAAVLGLIGMAYIFRSSNETREIDRAMQTLLGEIAAAAEKHKDSIGEFSLGLSDMDELRKVLEETFGELDPPAARKMLGICASVDRDVKSATKESTYFRSIVALCASGLVLSLVGLAFTDALSATFATVMVAAVGLVTLAAVVVICIFFFLLTRQSLSYWT